jgi:hypothetical protein
MWKSFIFYSGGNWGGGLFPTPHTQTNITAQRWFFNHKMKELHSNTIKKFSE